MWKKKCVACRLLAGIIISITSCDPAQGPRLQLLHTVTLASYPSASAMEYAGGNLYLFGDDATYGLVLDTSFHILDTVSLGFPSFSQLSKHAKPDIESVALLRDKGNEFLYAFGSGATENRLTIFRIHTADRSVTEDSLPPSLFQRPIAVNIEGAAIAGHHLLLANRANRTQRQNEILKLDFLSADSLQDATIRSLNLQLPEGVGLSGLFYIPETDLLLFTASTEHTNNAIEDGIIGDPYIGWIESFSKDTAAGRKPTRLINLAEQNDAFKKQKVESVCAKRLDAGQYIIYLAADNDDGKSRLFRAVLHF